MYRSITSVLGLALACLGLVTGCQHVATPPSAVPVVADAAKSPAAPAMEAESSYVFGWGDLPAKLAKPRGGTSRGAPVTLAPPRPLPVADAALPAFERDRAAILALAGDFRTSFHFMETLGFTPDYQPTQSYHSWATEHVRVLEDTGRFVSLQHTLVMFFQQEDGSVPEPMLVKHWRQDWAYEDTDLHTFRGAGTWARDRRPPESVAGTWSQAVFQVDDSPRYEAVGRWAHDGNRSVWAGESTWRPLPRREFSVRKDYDVLEGQHRIVLTPTGWLHVQDNWKREAGESDGGTPRYVAHEYGLDRYERITAPSLAAADDYWRKTGSYWTAVRATWRTIFAQRDRFTLLARVDGQPLFEHHFAYAEALAGDAPFDAVAAERHARETITQFLDPAPAP